MYVYYFQDEKKNFGDDINQWLWDALAPNLFDGDKSSWVSGIGSIIQDDMPEGHRKIIFSSGAGYGFLPKLSDKNWQVLCVRGPLTAEVLGLPVSSYVTDGAILLSCLEEGAPVPKEERQGIVFMPHHCCLDYSNWQEVCKKANIEFLSPREDSRTLIDRIRHAELVLADAMHAAIVADVVRVPWIPVFATPRPNSFKWLDWTRSMEIPFEPKNIPSSNLSELSEKIAYNILGGLYSSCQDVNQATQFFEKKFIQQSPKKYVVEKELRRFLSKFLRVLLKTADKTPFIQNLNNSMADKAAASLINVSKTPPFLSDELVFQCQKKKMEQKFSELKQTIFHLEDLGKNS